MRPCEGVESERRPSVTFSERYWELDVLKWMMGGDVTSL